MDRRLIKFNTNDHVWVKLTDVGRDYLRKTGEEFWLEPGARKRRRNGWTRWQLWELMRVFGGALGMGREVPFETEIKIEIPEG